MARVKAYGYLRVSSKGQVDGDGLRRQEDEVRSFAQAGGYELLSVFREEGVSGTLDEGARPAFQDMVATILKNGARTVIVEGLDRLAREYRIQEHLLVYLASKGIDLIVARTGENVTEAVLGDPMRRAMVQIQGVFAELEKGILVKKLRQGREEKRKTNPSGKCEGAKSIREASPELLSEIKALRKTLPGQKRKSFNDIAMILNERGYTSVTGKAFTGVNVQAILRRH